MPWGSASRSGRSASSSLILRPIVGWSSDRFGRRPLLIGGADRECRRAGAPPRCERPASCSPRRAACSAPARASSSWRRWRPPRDIAPEARRGEAISFLSLSLYLGIAIGPPVAEAIFAAGSYTAVWLGAATGVAAVAVALTLLVPESAPGVWPVDAGERARRAARSSIPPASSPASSSSSGCGGWPGS